MGLARCRAVDPANGTALSGEHRAPTAHSLTHRPNTKGPGYFHSSGINGHELKHWRVTVFNNWQHQRLHLYTHFTSIEQYQLHYLFVTKTTFLDMGECDNGMNMLSIHEANVVLTTNLRLTFPYKALLLISEKREPA